MSERLLRHSIESIYGARRAVHTRGTRTWTVSVFTLDPTQREADIARRFEGLGRVSSCTEFSAADRAERKFVVVLIVPARDVRDAIQTAGEVSP